jgi:hypothetical protein
MNFGHESVKMKSYLFLRIFQSVCMRLGNKQKSVTAQLISLYLYVIFTNKHSILSNPTTAIFAHCYNSRAKHQPY